MSTQAQTQVTPDRLMQMAWGFAPPLAVESAVRNRVFDALDAGPRSVSEVAVATGASPRGLAALMNLLVGLGLLAKDGERYALTPESTTFLVSTKPSFHGGLFRHVSRQLVPRFLVLDEVVRTGQPPARQHLASEFFEELVPSLFPMMYPGARALAQALELDRREGVVSVLDLGAGSGVWGIALAQASPNVRVAAVDYEGVLRITRQTAERFGLLDRFTFIPGDLLEADFGTGHTVATIGHILHSLGERHSRTLLQKTFDALAPGGTLAIAEFLVNEDRTGPMHGLIFAVNMLVNTDEGSTYSFGEIRQWLESAGFEQARTLDAPAASPLILAEKPR